MTVKLPGVVRAILSWLWRQLWPIGVVLVVIAAFALGLSWNGNAADDTKPTSNADEQVANVKFWTCAMHPQIKQPGPGRCPLCAMDLIPVTDDQSDDTDELPQLTVSRAAAALMEVQVTPVVRRHAEVELRMAGKVEYDETRLGNITARVGGRLDRLYVDYTGVNVKKGDHLVSLYSPQLLGAQEELLQALRAVKELAQSDVGIVRQTAQSTVDAVREKLRLWGLTASQIEQIEARGTGEDHITIYSPMSGIVIRKHAKEGMYVDTGTSIYTIADLSRVWVMLDAFETDLAWLRYGQTVTFSVEAMPGHSFTGTIAFIDPVLNDKRRTVRVRINVPNARSMLRPGMFVRGLVKAKVAAGGKVMDAALAGKWISPMHPEIVKDSPGTCDVCGMPLVRAEELGYVSPTSDAAVPLVIPATAPLITGRRAVVYVRLPGDADAAPVFEGREVVLGPRAGDHYIVEKGLSEGELVVTRGNFKIDSALQINAKPSMMNPTDAPLPPPAPASHQGHGGHGNE